MQIRLNVVIVKNGNFFDKYPLGGTLDFFKYLINTVLNH